jgi:hypothetical protein
MEDLEDVFVTEVHEIDLDEMDCRLRHRWAIEQLGYIQEVLGYDEDDMAHWMRGMSVMYDMGPDQGAA